jgi:hypothetical protein
MDNIHTNLSFTIKSIAEIVKNDMPLTESSLFGTLVEESRHFNISTPETT